MDILVLVIDWQSAMIGFIAGVLVGLNTPDAMHWLRVVWRRRMHGFR